MTLGPTWGHLLLRNAGTAVSAKDGPTDEEGLGYHEDDIFRWTFIFVIIDDDNVTDDESPTDDNEDACDSSPWR